MKRWIALLLVMSMLVTMLPPALAEAVVEIPEIPDGDTLIVGPEDAGGSPLEMTEVEIDDMPIEDFGESEAAEASEESSGEPESEGEEAVEAEETTSTEEVEATNAKQGKVPALLQLGVKEKYTLDTKGLANGAKITFTSSKASVAKVSAKGVITGVKAGSATVTIYNGKKKLATCKVKVVKAPTKVSFATKTVTLGVKETQTLTPTVPKGSHASYTWTVKNKKIATVSKDGVVKGIKAGKTTVTVKTHNGKKATVTVKVVKGPAKVSFAAKTVTLGVKETLTLEPTVPKGSHASYTWKVKNKKIATVTKDGVVKGVKVGKTTITVKTHNGKKATVTVKVVKAPTKVSFDVKTITIGIKEAVNVVPKVNDGARAVFTWTVANKKIAIVDNLGTITGVKAGSTKVTVKTQNGKKASLAVKVMKVPSKVTLNKKKVSIKEWGIVQLKATLPKSTASKIQWSSSNDDIASVDESGLVKAFNPGKVKITAQTYNGKKAVCTVTVVKDDSLESQQEAINVIFGEGNSVLDIGRIDSVFQPMPLTGGEGTKERKAIEEANELVELVNFRIEGYNQAYDALSHVLNEAGSSFQDTVTVKRTKASYEYTMGGITMFTDKAIVNAMNSGAKMVFRGVTEDGVGMFECAGKTIYIVATGNTISITGNKPNTSMRLATNAFISNENAIEKTVRFFKEQADWIEDTARNVINGIDQLISKTEELMEPVNKSIDHYREMIKWHYGDSAIEEQCYKAALEEAEKYKKAIRELNGLKAALKKVNIVGEAATLVDIALKFSEVVKIDLHDHPTEMDKKYQRRIEKSKELDKNIKVAYALFLGSCTMTLTNMYSTIVAISTGPIVGAILTLGSMMLASVLEDSVEKVYNDVKDIDEKLHSGVIYGKVTDEETKKPLKGVMVEISKCDSVVTGDDGTYEMIGVPKGNHNISFSRKDYKKYQQSVNVPENNEISLNVALKPSKGTVKGTITDSDTKVPLSGVEISGEGCETITDSNGNYVLKDVPIGQQKIVFKKEGYKTVNKTVTIEENVTVPLSFSMKENVGIVKGIVTDRDTTEPLGGVSISCEGCETVITDFDGRYTLLKVPAGKNAILYEREGYKTLEKTVDVTEGRVTPADADLKFMTGTVKGTVTDNETKKPLDGVIVSCDDCESMTTDAKGQYILQKVPVGKRKIYFVKDRYEKASDDIVVEEDREAILDMPLQRKTGNVEVYVIDSETQFPLAGVMVQCEDHEPSTTDSDGYCSFENVTEGSIEFTLILDRYDSVQQTEEVRQGQVTYVYVSMTRTPVAINKENFPDSSFRAFVKENYDDNSDNMLSGKEIDTVTMIRLFNYNLDTSSSISSFKGAEYFVLADKLVVQASNLAKTVEISSCDNLNYIEIQLTGTQELTVRGCKNLEDLECFDNQLKSLKVSGCPNLKCLICTGNQLKSLDVSALTDLEELWCDGNEGLGRLDVSQNKQLKVLRCIECGLTSLDVKNCKMMETLLCNGNYLTNLDASGLENLKWLRCSDNQLTSLNYSGCTSLDTLECNNNSLTGLDVNGLTNMEGFDCSDNRLASLDVSKNTSLTYLCCRANKLTKLNVKGNTKLENIDCSSNQLTSLDVSGLMNLEILNCSSNKLRYLGVSGCTSLRILDLRSNNLEDGVETSDLPEGADISW